MKVLLVTGYFAPGGTSAAFRNVYLVKYLTRLGVDVQVLTYDEQALTLFATADASLTANVPASVPVHRVGLGQLRRRVRRTGLPQSTNVEVRTTLKRAPGLSLLVPDPHVDAIPGFVRAGTRVVRDFQPDVVLTHGYPFSMLLVGRLLKRRFPHLRWVADYGDPWTGNPVEELRRPRWRHVVDERLERWMLRAADAVTVTTRTTQRLYEQTFPFLAGRVETIPMGFDPEEFEALEPLPRPTSFGSAVVLVHTGKLYSEARDPGAFVRAVAELRDRHAATSAQLRIVLVGEVEPALRQLIERTAPEFFEFVPWVPVKESLRWMKTADWLLLFGNKGSMQIPGKVYQYVGSGTPILMARIEADDPTAAIVEETRGARVVSNVEGDLIAALRRILEDGPRIASIPAPARSPYSWRAIAEHMAAVCAGMPSQTL